MTKNWTIPRVLVASLLLVATALAQTPAIDWWVIGGGGESGEVGGTSLDGTIGQWAVGGGTSGTTQLESGFWGGGGAGSYQVLLPVVLRQCP